MYKQSMSYSQIASASVIAKEIEELERGREEDIQNLIGCIFRFFFWKPSGPKLCQNVAPKHGEVLAKYGPDWTIH